MKKRQTMGWKEGVANVCWSAQCQRHVRYLGHSPEFAPLGVGFFYIIPTSLQTQLRLGNLPEVTPLLTGRGKI